MSTYKVYVAAPWASKETDARLTRDRLVHLGIECTSRWIDFPGDSQDPEVLEEEAYNDWEDVLRADALLLLNLQKRGEETSGKAVETGIALQAGKNVFMVGTPSNIFHHLSDEIIQCASVDEAIDRIELQAELARG